MGSDPTRRSERTTAATNPSTRTSPNTSQTNGANRWATPEPADVSTPVVFEVPAADVVAFELVLVVEVAPEACDGCRFAQAS